MAEDITSLQIKILYDSVTQAEKRLKDLEATGKKTESTTKRAEKNANSLMGSLLRLAGAYVTVTGVARAFNAVIQTTRQFDTLRANVTTAVGSVEKMEEAWAALVDFARDTPFTLDQSVESFTRLINYGLTPSERAMKSYGNTAAATNKQMLQLVEGVADAVNGEFERIKEAFNVKGKNLGDEVEFRFRGVTTRVKNNAKEIEEYFIKLGENNFADGMANRMKTLDGAFANLEDSWQQLLYSIGKEGLGDTVNDALRTTIGLIDELTAMVQSGQLGAEIDGWAISIEGFASSWMWALDEVNNALAGHGEKAKETGITVGDVLIEGPKAALIGYQAFVETMSTILWALVDSTVQIVDAIVSTFGAGFNTLIQSAFIAGKAIANALNPFSEQSAGQTFQQGFNDIVANAKKNSAEVAKTWDQAIAKTGINIDVAGSNIGDAWDNAKNKINAATMAEAEGNEKRKQWDADSEKRAKDRADRLAKYGLGVDGSSNSKGKKGGKGGGGGSGNSEWETLEKSLRDQETLISESYERRMQLIEKNTRDGSAYQAELQLSLTEKFEEEQERRLSKMKEQPERMFEAYEQEEQIIEDSYERRKQIILSATELTEAERLKMLEEAELQYTSSMRKHEIERNKMALGLASDFFGNLSELAGAFGKKGSKIAKAAAIAQTTIKTYEAATSAYASLAGIPYVGPVLGAAAAAAAIAAGVANIQKIRSTNDAGAYANGGIVPGASFTGDNLTARVNSGEMILNGAQQRQLWEAANGGGSGGVKVNVHNYAGQGVQATATASNGPDGQTVDVIVKMVEKRVARNFAEGSSPLAPAMEKAYGLRRGA